MENTQSCAPATLKKITFSARHPSNSIENGSSKSKAKHFSWQLFLLTSLCLARQIFLLDASFSWHLFSWQLLPLTALSLCHLSPGISFLLGPFFCSHLFLLFLLTTFLANVQYPHHGSFSAKLPLKIAGSHERSPAHHRSDVLQNVLIHSQLFISQGILVNLGLATLNLLRPCGAPKQGPLQFYLIEMGLPGLPLRVGCGSYHSCHSINRWAKEQWSNQWSNLWNLWLQYVSIIIDPGPCQTVRRRPEGCLVDVRGGKA